MLSINSIVCGDCSETIAAIPPESIDLVVFSPPYDGIRDYKKDTGWVFDHERLGEVLYRAAKPGAVCAVRSLRQKR